MTLTGRSGAPLGRRSRSAGRSHAPADGRAAGSRGGSVARLAALLMPAGLTVYLAFNQGGFFPGTTGLVAVAVALILVLRVTLASKPLEGVSSALLLALVPLSLYAAWVLASAAWSDAPAEALIEFDKALLYVLTLLLFGSIARSPEGLRSIVRGLALAAVVVCLAGLISKLLPELWPTEPSANGRLDFPLTYEGALGLLAALGIVWSIYMATSHRQGALARALGAAAVPILATTLLLTLSRAGLVALAAGLLAYVVVARPRALVPGLLAVVPPTVVAVVVTYGAEALFRPLAVGESPPAASGVAVVVLLCAIGAGLLRALLVPVDKRLAAVELSPGVRRVVTVSAAGAALLAVGAALALGVPAAIDRYEGESTAEQAPEAEDDARTRLTAATSSVQVRLDYWGVALDRFATAPFKGTGAGGYADLWARERPVSAEGAKVEDAHSLYLETLAELGVVGLVLLGGALAATLVGLLLRARGEARALYGVLFAAALAWAVHAALDWDWEMPAVTLWLFAAGGAGLALPRKSRPLFRAAGLPVRVVIAVAILVLAATPALVALSQLHLQDSQTAATEGDCGEAIDSALASISVLGMRPEPYETLGYCDLRLGAVALAPDAFERAIELDPDDWRYHYGLAIARAANGEDPRRAASAARRLNPLNPQTTELVRLFATNDPGKWKRRAEEARPALD